jgi:hypothetical protein
VLVIRLMIVVLAMIAIRQAAPIEAIIPIAMLVVLKAPMMIVAMVPTNPPITVGPMVVPVAFAAMVMFACVIPLMVAIEPVIAIMPMIVIMLMIKPVTMMAVVIVVGHPDVEMLRRGRRAAFGIDGGHGQRDELLGVTRVQGQAGELRLRQRDAAIGDLQVIAMAVRQRRVLRQAGEDDIDGAAAGLECENIERDRVMKANGNEIDIRVSAHAFRHAQDRIGLDRHRLAVGDDGLSVDGIGCLHPDELAVVARRKIEGRAIGAGNVLPDAGLGIEDLPLISDAARLRLAIELRGRGQQLLFLFRRDRD